MARRDVLILVLAVIVIIPLVAAAWLPPGLPLLLRQVLLCVWGVGAILAAERLFFSRTLKEARVRLGGVGADRSTLAVAVLASLPMWVFLPLFALAKDVAVNLRPDFLSLFLGVVLVNGITEEVIHRGFVFGHLRRTRSFAAAATVSAALFAAQHLYIIVTTGWTIGLASVVLAALLAYPLALRLRARRQLDRRAGHPAHQLQRSRDRVRTAGGCHGRCPCAAHGSGARWSLGPIGASLVAVA